MKQLSGDLRYRALSEKKVRNWRFLVLKIDDSNLAKFQNANICKGKVWWKGRFSLDHGLLLLCKIFWLDYTCRARWPEGLLCSTISLKSCNLAQILQSPKSEIVTCVMFSTHTNTSLIKPHLTELDEIHRNRPKSNYNLAKNLQSWSFLERYIGRTHTQTEIHTFFIWHPRVGREHNSPSGNNEYHADHKY